VKGADFRTPLHALLKARQRQPAWGGLTSEKVESGFIAVINLGEEPQEYCTGNLLQPGQAAILEMGEFVGVVNDTGRPVIFAADAYVRFTQALARALAAEIAKLRAARSANA
jgi:hypothetical protein